MLGSTKLPRPSPGLHTRLRAWFEDYNDLANGVHHLLGVELPPFNLDSLRKVADARPREVTKPTGLS